MSLATAMRDGVAAIRGVLAEGDLLATVQRKPWIGVDENGRDTYGPLVTLTVLYEDTDATIVRFEGATMTVRGKLTLLDGTVTSAKDRWVTPDGRERPVSMHAPGVTPATGGRFLTEIWLG